ncbi:MAG: hypothetical protein AAGF28_04230 [Pseudomonadota bacterium]
MFALVVQTILLIAIAFILGCVIGCLLHRMFGSSQEETQDASASAAPAVGVGAVAASAAVIPAAPVSQPVVKKAPVVPTPPKPVVPQAPAEPAKVAKPAPIAQAPAKKSAAPKKSTSKAAAAKPGKRVASAAKAAPAAAATPDNLKMIKGIGPQNEGRLNALGINSFAQIASWKKKDQAHYGDVLAFPGRIEREDWVGQAKVLTKGGATQFSKRVKSGAVESSSGKAVKADLGSEPKNLLSAPKGGKADNLTLIDGVGNAIERKMFKLGIHHFDQVAKLTKAELAWLGNAVGFPGRPERENWKGEAKILAAGGTTEHAKKVERGQIKTSRKS